MQLESLLVRNKGAILDDWFRLFAETYPADSAQFLHRENDAFANPLGASARNGLEAVFDELLGGGDPRALTDFLDPIIRIRAIQNFSPSQALGFVFFLKKSIRNVLSEDLSSPALQKVLCAFETKIDDLALLGFEIYMECREKIYQLKEKEVKNQALYVFSQEGLIGNKPA